MSSVLSYSLRLLKLKSLGSTKSNDALHISLVTAGEHSPDTLSTFHPQFTYPIFGEEERIFGYQNLHIDLKFAAHDLRPNIEISYDKKLKAVGDTRATDLTETLRPWTPEGMFARLSTHDWGR